MTGCAEHRMQAGGRNTDRAGSLQETAVVGEADKTREEAQAARRVGRGRSSWVPPFLLPATPPRIRRRSRAGVRVAPELRPDSVVLCSRCAGPAGPGRGVGHRRAAPCGSASSEQPSSSSSSCCPFCCCCRAASRRQPGRSAGAGEKREKRPRLSCGRRRREDALRGGRPAAGAHPGMGSGAHPEKKTREGTQEG